MDRRDFPWVPISTIATVVSALVAVLALLGIPAAGTAPVKETVVRYVAPAPAEPTRLEPAPGFGEDLASAAPREAERPPREAAERREPLDDPAELDLPAQSSATPPSRRAPSEIQLKHVAR